MSDRDSSLIFQVVAEKNFRIKDLSGQTRLVTVANVSIEPFIDCSIDRSDMDQSVKQFFEVITSEHALST